jgi:hypothetical protein
MTIKQQGGIFGRNPTFNDVDVDGSLNVNNDNLYVNSNTVGIGTNNPVSLITGGDGPILSIGGTDNVLTNDEKTGTISFITSDGSYKGTYSDGIAAEIACITETATGAGYGLAFYTGVTTASNRAERLRISRSGDVELKTGNLVVPSGNGIDFSATSGTGTSELFDDYEEGTWTPVFSDASSGGNTASGSSYGYYVKVGGLVYVTGQFENVNTTGMTGGNLLYVQGIPYTPSSLANDIFFMGSVKSDGVTNSGFVNVEAIDNYAWLRFSETNNTTAGHLTVSDFASGTADIFFSLCYRAI